jgi:hypothetical protein
LRRRTVHVDLVFLLTMLTWATTLKLAPPRPRWLPRRCPASPIRSEPRLLFGPLTPPLGACTRLGPPARCRAQNRISSEGHIEHNRAHIESVLRQRAGSPIEPVLEFGNRPDSTCCRTTSVIRVPCHRVVPSHQVNAMGGAMGGPEVPVDELRLQVSFEVLVP